jgi:hypothetical protein
MRAPTSHRRAGLEEIAPGDDKLSHAFAEHLDTLRQLDRALRLVERWIRKTQADPPLQAFWCGVRRDYQTEAHRLARRIGTESIQLSWDHSEAPCDLIERRTFGWRTSVAANPPVFPLRKGGRPAGDARPCPPCEGGEGGV